MGARIGLVGLGTMGSALALNIAEKGFEIAVYNRTPSVTDAFMATAGPLAKRLTAAATPEALVADLTAPRAILIMVNAGGPVDSVIASLLPYLAAGDLLIDGGNADFNDTRRREADLKGKGIRFFGMGVSGGEEGARHGPSIMVGGPAEAYEPVRDIIEAIAGLDADVISIETTRSRMELLQAFGTYNYPNEIGPGIWDIHSPRVPGVAEMEELLLRAAACVPADRLWVNPDCGLKTRGWEEVQAALGNLVQAARNLRAKLAA